MKSLVIFIIVDYLVDIVGAFVLELFLVGSPDGSQPSKTGIRNRVFVVQVVVGGNNSPYLLVVLVKLVGDVCGIIGDPMLFGDIVDTSNNVIHFLCNEFGVSAGGIEID